MKFKNAAYMSAILGAYSAVHAEQTTNSMTETYVPPDRMLTEVPENGSIGDIFDAQLGKRGASIAFDRFGPPSELFWVERSKDYGFWSERNKAGRNAFQNIGLYSLRETAVSLPGIADRQGLVVDFLKGTIGNTDEERLGSDAIANAEENSWRRRLEESGFTYGVRPFNTRPYLYGGWVWRDKDGAAILYEDTRIRYVLPDDIRVEEHFIKPITASWQASLAAGGNVRHIAGKESDSKISLSLDKIADYLPAFSTGVSVSGTGEFRTIASVYFSY